MRTTEVPSKLSFLTAYRCERHFIREGIDPRVASFWTWNVAPIVYGLKNALRFRNRK